VVLLIDALNQFEPTPRGLHLTWLPRLWPENARLIATTIPGTQSQALERRDGGQEFPLPLLNQEEARAIAVAVCGRYHRKLNEDVLRALLDKKRDDGEPSAGIPLWLELALEELQLLDADDFERAQREYTGSGDERLRQMMCDVAAGLPGDVERLYGQMLARCETLYGAGWARGFAALIAVSRHGWREADLAELLPRAAWRMAPDEPDEPWNDLRFAALRRGFRAHLVQRGAQSQWDFSHAQMRLAVRPTHVPAAAPYSLVLQHGVPASSATPGVSRQAARPESWSRVPPCERSAPGPRTGGSTGGRGPRRS